MYSNIVSQAIDLLLPIAHSYCTCNAPPVGPTERMKHSNKSSLPVPSGDDEDSSSVVDKSTNQNDRSSSSSSSSSSDNNKKSSSSSGILRVSATIVSLALIGVAATCTVGYYNHFASNDNASPNPLLLHRPSSPSSGKLIVPADERRARQLKEHIAEKREQKRGLQRFGDDGESPVTASSVMAEEEPVIHTYGFASMSDADIHALLYGEEENSDSKREDAIIMANEKPIVEVDSTIMDETENIVTVDQSTTPATRRRNAVAAKQTLFAADDEVVISFFNTIDVQPGDFVAIVPSNIDVSAGLMDGDYVAYTYVCPPGSDTDTTFDCPRYGSVAWDAGDIPPGRYKAYLAMEDRSEPYTVKAATSGPFMVRGAPTNRAEVIETPRPTSKATMSPTMLPTTSSPTAGPTTSPTAGPTSGPTEDPNGSLTTLMNGGIRNNGVIFEVRAKRDVRITSIDFHTPLLETIPLSVYTTSGTAVGKERDLTQWQLVAYDEVLGQGDHRKTNVSVDKVIRAGRRVAFYLDTPSVFIPGPIRYSPSNIPTGGVYSQDKSVSILVGYGMDPYFGESYPNRIFNGGVNYEKL